MRVTKTDPLLLRLVSFLNFDFEGETEASLKESRLSVYELDQRGWKRRGKSLQEEIRSDVVPLLSETPTDNTVESEKILKLRRKWLATKPRGNRKQQEMMLNLTTAVPRAYHGPEFYLDRLLEKVNRLNLRFRWYAESGHYQTVVYAPDFSKPLPGKLGYPEPIIGTERKKPNSVLKLLGPERRIISLVGEKFIVARQLSYANSLREQLYGIVAESLENGSFTNVRLCPQCGKFFLGRTRRGKFCGDHCKNQFFNLKKDMKKYREMSRKIALTKARRLFKQGNGAASIIEETGLPQRVLRKEGLLR